LESQVLEGYQLSPQQKSLWPEQQRSPALCARAVLRIEGDLDDAVLAAALQDVVDRQEILRTAFERLPGMDLPIQVVAERLAVAWEDAGGPELAAQEPAFDLVRPPLVRFRLARSEPGTAWLLIALPAVCADARSLANLAGEITAAYRARQGGGEMADPPLQYIEFSEWRHSLFEEPDAEPGRGHWRRQHEVDPGPPFLPLENLVDGSGELVPAAVDVPLPPAVRDLLDARAAEWEVTPAGIQLAAWAALLRRLAGGPDVTVHVRFDGRKFPELRGALGLFEQLLPVTLGVDLAAPLSDLAGRAVRAVEDAHVWQEYFVSADEAPLPVAFEPAAEEPSLGSEGRPSFVLERFVAHSAPFKLKLCVAAGSATLWYDARCFDAAEVGLLANRWAALLLDALERPAAPVSELTLLGEAERRLVVEEWNRTALPFAADTPVHRQFEAQACRTPEAPAVFCDGRVLTFRELDARAGRLARFLRRRGVAPGSLVVLCLERSEEMIVALLAILKAGGAYVPLDAGQPRARLERMLSDARVSLVVTERTFAAVFAAPGAPVVCLDAERERIAAEDAEPLEVEVLPEHPAYVIFTSGSTGQPKGALIRHRAVSHLASALAATVYAGIDDPLRVAVNAPLAFDASVKQVIQLLAGHALVIVPEDVRRDGGALLAFLAESGTEVLDATPSQVRLLLAAGLDEASCPSLRRVLVGGEAIDSPLWRALAGWRTVRFWNVYGPTECTVDVTACPIEAGAPALGRPLPNVRAYVLDAAGRPLPVGVAGELCVAGEGLARGYVHQPAATAAKFVPDPFGGRGERLYRTGDLTRWRPEGCLEFIGRVDHQVKVRGFRIELGEIEAVLALHSGLRESVVTVRDDPSGDSRLVAYVVPGPSGALDVDELRAFLRERLPEYMLPSAYVRLDALPLTRNGKVDRAALPDPEKAAGRERLAGHQPPRNQIQELLAGLWEEVLGYERIGVEANFFELGGHSLLATQLIARVRQVFQIDLLLRTLFDAPTIAGLAVAIEGALRTGDASVVPPLVPVARDHALPLSFPQERLWFLDRLAPGNPFYNIPLRTRLSGALDVGVLARTFGEIVRRHEVLRTHYQVDDGGRPVQVIDPAGPFHLPVVDVSALPVPVGEEEALRLAREEAARPFDLERGPLLRGHLVRLAESEHAALLTLHHIAGDGWSLGVLIREIGAIYEAFCRSRPAPFPELPVQYADYAVWQRGWLQGEVLESQLATWRRRLAGAPPFLEIPTDRPRPELPRHRGGRHRLLLSSGIAGALRRLCRRERTSLFMALLGAFQVLLSRLSGSLDISVGTPFSGRTRLETESLVGFFVNTLVLRTSLAGAPGFHELLGRVREVALEADAHQDLPFEKLVEELQPERSLSRTPLFQVMLVFQNTPQEGREMPGLRLSPLGVDTDTAKFDLTLTLSELGERIGGVLDYDMDLFDATTTERFLASLTVLLEGVVADPEAPVSALPLLRPEERHALLLEWNDTEFAVSGEATLHGLFEAQAARTPDAVAVEAFGVFLRYGELDRRAESLARRLAGLGVGLEVRVGICAERSLDLVIGLLAILKAGGSWVALDPGVPDVRLALMIEDARPPVLLVQDGLRERLAPLAGGARLLDFAADEEAGERWIEGGAGPDNAAYVLFTSGSTGRPKGVVNTHRGIVNRLLWMQSAYGLTAEDRVLHKTPFGFDVSVWELFWPLLTGAHLVIARPGGHQDGAYLVRTINESGITHLHFVPSMLRVFLEEPRLESCASLRRVIASGEALPSDLARRFHELLGGPCGVELHNLYGPTEAAVDVTFHACRPGEERVPIGRPVARTRIHLLDRQGQLVPLGVAGELHIGGVQVGRGYLEQPGLTAELFVPDPFGTAGGRLYRTGDLARVLPDGEVEYLGRIDQQVKIRGVRIELGEIESVLSDHPAVREAAAVARQDLAGGPGIAAFVVFRPEMAATFDELRTWMLAQLPEAMLPSAVVPLGALPLTTSGKLDRRTLEAQDLARAQGSGAGPAAYQPPRDPLELRLCRIWEELLRVGRVGIRDSFFALGGSSLAAIRLQILVERSFGWRFDLAALFRAPTIEGIAGHVRRRGAARFGSLVELGAGGSGRPVFWVHPAGGEVLCYADLVRRLGGDRPHYGVRAKGLQAGETPRDQLAAMAAAYVEEVLAVDPAGPQVLGGWSLGGVLAFEMARQLQAAGREVPLVVLIDTQAPEAELRDGLSDWDLLGAFAQGLGLQDRFLLPDEDERSPVAFDASLARLLDRAQADGVLPAGLELADMQRIFAVQRGNSRALRGYTGGTYDGRLLLMRAAERADRNDLRRGWDRLAPRLEVHEVPGNHHTLVREPHVRHLAERVRICLETRGV
jgi:amino acid adenylation domain-containing protein